MPTAHPPRGSHVHVPFPVPARCVVPEAPSTARRPVAHGRRAGALERSVWLRSAGRWQRPASSGSRGAPARSDRRVQRQGEWRCLLGRVSRPNPRGNVPQRTRWTGRARLFAGASAGAAARGQSRVRWQVRRRDVLGDARRSDDDRGVPPWTRRQRRSRLCAERASAWRRSGSRGWVGKRSIKLTEWTGDPRT
jgi:hypothetical protein